MKLKFNACPKCGGDLHLRRDIYGMFVNCLQCGLQRDLDAPTKAVEVTRPDTEVAPVRPVRGILARRLDFTSRTRRKAGASS